METVNTLYSYFDTALLHVIEDGGHGFKNWLALEVGVSNAHISQVVSRKNKKRASQDLQEKIAVACGYTLEDFLKRGKALLSGAEVQPAEQRVKPKLKQPELIPISKLDPVILQAATEYLDEELKRTGKKISLKKRYNLISILYELGVLTNASEEDMKLHAKKVING